MNPTAPPSTQLLQQAALVSGMAEVELLVEDLLKQPQKLKQQRRLFEQQFCQIEAPQKQIENRLFWNHSLPPATASLKRASDKKSKRLKSKWHSAKYRHLGEKIKGAGPDPLKQIEARAGVPPSEFAGDRHLAARNGQVLPAPCLPSKLRLCRFGNCCASSETASSLQTATTSGFKKKFSLTLTRRPSKISWRHPPVKFGNNHAKGTLRSPPKIANLVEKLEIAWGCCWSLKFFAKNNTLQLLGGNVEESRCERF